MMAVYLSIARTGGLCTGSWFSGLPSPRPLRPACPLAPPPMLLEETVTTMPGILQIIKLILKELQCLSKLTQLLNCGATIEFSLVVVLIWKRPALGRRALGRRLSFPVQPSSSFPAEGRELLPWSPPSVCPLLVARRSACWT